MKSLTKTPDTHKVSKADYERVYALYVSKKSQLTLDGKSRVVISKLTTKFPIVSIAGSGFWVEYSHKAVERILNGNCKFSS